MDARLVSQALFHSSNIKQTLKKKKKTCLSTFQMQNKRPVKFN